MYPKTCDDPQVIRAVQSYIRRIRNAEKRAYAEAFWAAVYNEAAHGVSNYPDSSTYDLSYMGAQAVRMSISDLIQQNRSAY